MLNEIALDRYLEDAMAPRTRTREVKEKSIALIEIATAQWDAERAIDADAIAGHIETVRSKLEWIGQWEAQQIDHARACALQMRQQEQTMLTALQNHLTDIRNAGAIEHEPVKKINGGKP